MHCELVIFLLLITLSTINLYFECHQEFLIFTVTLLSQADIIHFQVQVVELGRLWRNRRGRGTLDPIRRQLTLGSCYQCTNHPPFHKSMELDLLNRELAMKTGFWLVVLYKLLFSVQPCICILVYI